MLTKISAHLKEKIATFSDEDKIIFNNNLIEINKTNFQEIKEEQPNKTIAFIDGGQAEIISTGNFCLSFIRVAALISQNNKKIDSIKKEFYLLTTAKYQDNDLVYESKMFGDQLIKEEDILISSNDNSIKTGTERAPISKVVNMARRFAELSLAATINSDFIVLDGTLEPTFKDEEKYLMKLNNNISALAKSSSLFTISGNSPVILLNKIGLCACWNYFLDDKTYFVKLNENSKHVFRFEGNKEVLPFLITNCNDALFLGYPYGLIAVDKLARVSNAEKNSLKMNFLLRRENKEIVEYLHNSDAHSILDNLG